MKIEKFTQEHLKFKDIKVLEVYQGYLIAGKIKKAPRCVWINKQNIEGLAEVAKIVAIESAFHGILSLIPGGSFAYRLIKDQIGYPPRYNVTFEPLFYEITYSVITLDKEGEKKGAIDGLIQSVDSITKMAFKTGTKVQSALTELILKGDKRRNKEKADDRSKLDILGFTYIRFDDITSLIRNKVVKERISETKSSSKKLIKKTASEIVPPVVISYKTTANDEATDFLKHLKKLGFVVKFSESIIDEIR
ncbi:MAG: hypothetical protein ACW97X_02400 [Candidatus Hodarchaeales archaeon]|jgi:hypothetical protein